MIPLINELIHRLKTELIDPVYNGRNKDGHTQTTEPELQRPVVTDVHRNRSPLGQIHSDSNLR